MQTLDEVLEEMAITEAERKDLNMPLNALEMRDDGKLHSSTYGELEPSDAAINRLCKNYRMSNSHISTLADEGRYDLIADQFNHFLTKDNNIMQFRLVDDNRIKGIVNKNYKKFDDYDLFTQVEDYLNDNNFDYRLDMVTKDDEYTRIRFIINDVNQNMGVADEGGNDSDIVNGGFEITNSEIGMRNMGVNSLIYRQICTNGMMGLVSDEDNKEIFFKRDRDFNPFSKRTVLNRGLDNAVEKSDKGIYLFRKTKDIPVEEPREEIQKIGNQYNLGKNHVESVQDCFEKEQQHNYFGVLNSFSRHGRNLNKHDYRNRAKLEFIANDVMNKVAG